MPSLADLERNRRATQTTLVRTVLAFLILLGSFPQAGALTAKRQAFTTKDGVILCGDVYAAGKKAPTVILWHMLGRNRTDLATLVPSLLAQGYSVINMDQRGHGQSIYKTDKTTIDFNRFSEEDWSKLPSDALLVAQDVQRLPNLNGKCIGIVGSSIGANMAAMATGDPNVKAVVMLSPGSNYHGMQPEQALKTDTKPALMIASKQDSFSINALSLWGNKKSIFQTSTVQQRAHGDDLIKDQSVVREILAFFKSNLKP